MKALAKRLDALEGVLVPDQPTRTHWIIGEPDESEEEAIARYEREHGPVGDGENVIVWVIVTRIPRVEPQP